MITELLQQPGSFEISLRDGTPITIRRQVAYTTSSGLGYGHIAVTPQRLPPQTLTKTAVLAVARWTGRIQSRSNRMHTFAGHGLPVWLGDADDKADAVNYAPVGAVTMTTAVTAAIGSGVFNGITLGSTAADSGTTIATTWTNVLPIEFLNQFADATGNAWRINPDGTLDLGTPSTLFNGTPIVILMREQGGHDIAVTGLYCPDLDVAEDFDDYATICVYTGQSATGLAALVTVPKDFGGTNDSVAIVNISGNANTGAACNSASTNYLNLHATTRRQITASVVADDPGYYLRPGDQVYLYDPDCGLTDLANQVAYLGRVLQPAKAMLRGMTWPVVQGMGVYSIQTQDGSNTVVDLTDWIAWETGSTRLELGAPSRSAAQSTTKAFGTRTA